MNYNFDMDGTIADFYGVNGWIDYLNNEDTTPYEIAKPLVNMTRLARALNKASRRGDRIVIISWTSKNATAEYAEAIAQAKRKWLARHLPSVQWDEIHIVAYGTPKHTIGNGILFDDEIGNRKAWGMGGHTPEEIFDLL